MKKKKHKSADALLRLSTLEKDVTELKDDFLDLLVCKTHDSNEDDGFSTDNSEKDPEEVINVESKFPETFWVEAMARTTNERCESSIEEQLSHLFFIEEQGVDKVCELQASNI